jgi:deoxycytidylate deaminase
MRKKDQLNRDDYWMGLAFMVAAGKPDSSGAIIVGVNSELLAAACDGMPRVQETNHIIPAEMNVLFNCNTQNSTIYLTHTPSYQSCLLLIAANVKRIVYFSTGAIEDKCLDAMVHTFTKSEEYRGNLNWMRDYLKSLEMLEIFRAKQA